MQPPRFWYRPRGVLAALLSPLGTLYAAGTARRLKRGSGTQIGVPVICVGNINVGGTGKTPTVIALIERLHAMGRAPHVVSRGYGGTEIGPLEVSERDHTAAMVGDEPLLLAAFAPTWIARDRIVGANAAMQAGADVIILDDGFQDPGLAKSLSLVVVDALRGFGNGCVLPAGPLREPVGVGIARADSVLSIGPEDAQELFLERWGGHIGASHLSGELKPLQTGIDWQGLRVLAFAGIGHPEKFFATLRKLGADIVKSEGLDDHQPLTEALMKRLGLEADAMGAQLVTTEKDAVRLSKSFRQKVITVPVRLEFNDLGAIDALLSQTLKP